MRSLGFLLCAAVLASSTTKKVTLTVTGARPVTVGKALALTPALSDGKPHGITWTVTPAEAGLVCADDVFRAHAVGTAAIHAQVQDHPEGAADLSVRVAAVPDAAVTVDLAARVTGAVAHAQVPAQADMTYR